MRLWLIILFLSAFHVNSQCNFDQNQLDAQRKSVKKIEEEEKNKNWTAAIEQIDLVLAMSKDCPKDTTYRSTLSKRLMVYIYQNELEKGINFADSILPKLKRDTTDRVLAEIIYHKALCLYRLRKIDEASVFFENLEKNEEGYLEKGDPLYFSIYNMLGQCYKPTNLNKALKVYQKNLGFLDRAGTNDHHERSITYHNIAAIYTLKGEFIQEEYYLKAAISERLKEDDINEKYLALSYNNLGVSYARQKKPDQAITNYLKAIDLYENLGNYGQLKLWTSYVNLATEYVVTKNWLKAEEFGQKAIDKLKSEKNISQTNLQFAYSMMARTYRTQGKRNESLWYFKKSIEHDGKYLAGNLARFSNYYSRQNRLDSAKIYTDQSVHFMVHGTRIDTTGLYEVPSTDEVVYKPSALDVIKRKQAIYLLLYEETGKIEYLKIAYDFSWLNMNVLNRKKQEAVNHSAIVTLLERNYSIYSKTIQASLLMFEHFGDSSFLMAANNALEQSRQGVLQKLLLPKIDDIYPDLDDALRYEENEIRKSIKKMNRALESAKSKSDNVAIDSIKVSLAEIDLERTQLIEKLQNSHPDYSRIKYSESRKSILEKQKQLSAGTNLIEFHVDQSSEILTTFSITKNNYQYRTTTLDSIFLDQLKTFVEMVKNPSSDAHSYQDLAHAIYQNLLAHMIDVGAKRLVIVPHDILHFVPFDALVSSKVERANFSNLKYILHDYDVSISHGFGFHDDMTSNSAAYAGFAPVEYNDLPDLPNAEKELLGSGKNFIFQEATEEAFRGHAKDAGIIHLATHGVLNDSMPLHSHLLLNGNEKEDGALKAYEIFGLDLNANLAILSACNTGNGKTYKGEGVLSMAKAFQFAGCPSVLMTLWETEDASTSQIVQTFLVLLQDGKRLDEALTNAKKAYLKNAHPTKAHPYYWSATQLNGPSEPLFELKSKTTKDDSSIPWPFIIGFVVLAGVVITIVIGRKRSKPTT